MNLLKSDRFWLLGGALSAVLVAALAWFFAVGPELSNASSLDSQTTDAQVQNITLQSKIHRLQKANADMTTLTGALVQARAALPVSTDIAAYTRQLTSYAAGSHVVVTGISAATPVSATSKPGQPSTPAAGSAAGELYALPLTVIVKGPVSADLKFLHAVQADQRAALVTATQLANDSSANSRLTQLTVQLEVFVAPLSPDATAALQKLLITTSK